MAGPGQRLWMTEAVELTKTYGKDLCEERPAVHRAAEPNRPASCPPLHSELGYGAYSVIDLVCYAAWVVPRRLRT